MNTTLSTKLAALMLALVVNSVIMGGVALMFNARTHQAAALNVAANVTQQNPGRRAS
jgi:Mn2+/Fe2+ NRAMP family transporter